MRTYSGIDLHSSNNYVGVIDDKDQRLYRKRLPNRLDTVLYLLTVPGIGDILTLTIMLEVGDINRFAKVRDYSSYCRCVIPPKRRDQWQKEG